MADRDNAGVATQEITRSALGEGGQDSPSRSTAAASVVGGALAVAGFFLPWTVTSHFDPPSGSTITTTISGWDIINRWLTGHLIAATGSQTTGPTAPSYAVVVGFPLLLGLLALVIGVSMFVRRPGPLLFGLHAAAGIMGALVAINEYPPLFVLQGAFGSPGPSTVDLSQAGLGLLAVNIGFFIVIASSIAAAIRPAR